MCKGKFEAIKNIQTSKWLSSEKLSNQNSGEKDRLRLEKSWSVTLAGNLKNSSCTTAQKYSFSLWISSVNVTKSEGNCGFGQIYWKIP